MWWEGDYEDASYDDNDAVAQWTDLSGAGNHGTQSDAGNKPTFKAAIINGHDVLRFNGTSAYLEVPDLSSLTSAHIFVVMKLDNDPTLDVVQSGLWHFQTAGDDSNMPYTDGNYYDAFASNARKSTGDPAFDFDSGFGIYSVKSVSGEWTSWVNGQQHYTTGSNTVAISSVPVFGRNAEVSPGRYVDGDVAEVIMYSAGLSSSDRVSVENYLSEKYSIAVESSSSSCSSP